MWYLKNKRSPPPKARSALPPSPPPPPPRTWSILDLPFAQYDPSTRLPDTIIIGSREERPVVSIEDGMSPVCLLEQF